MKRKLNDDAPPAKKRKIEDDVNDEKDEADPSIIIPKLKVMSVQNGIIQMEISNIDPFIDQEQTTDDFYEFELMYKRGDSEWKSLQTKGFFDQMFFETFYVKSSEEIEDYTLQLKIRSKLRSRLQPKSEDRWSPFCDTLSIQIKSSLIAHKYSVGQYVEFRDEKEYYSRSGRIIEVFSDNKVRIRPYPKFLSHNKDNDDDDSDADMEDDDAEFLEFIENHTNNNNNNDNDNVNDNDVVIDMVGALANYFNDDNQKSKDIDLPCSRLYGDGIRLSQVIDISNNENEMDRMLLLGDNDHLMMETFDALKCSLFEYAKKNESVYPDEQYEFKYMARFVSKNVCDFIMENKDACKWKIGCLRESTDGNMKLNAVRSDIINARILGLKANIDGMSKYDIDNVVGFCDICMLEISGFDWRYNCDEHITNRHDVCMQCAYNVVKQHIQLKDLLFPLLEKELNNDCIQEIAAFVVGSVVQL